MTPSTVQPPARVLAFLLILMNAGCASLVRHAPAPMLYGLGQPAAASMPLRSQGIDGGRIATTLLVGVPRAVAGFDSPRIIYVRDADQRHVYTDSAWIDTPARMISPLIVARIADSGLFRGVVAAPSSMAADVRLDTEIVSLQQEFTVIPSRVRIHVRAYLAVESTRRLLAWTNLEATVPARSEDAIGAVKAAQEAVRIVIADLEDFCLHALAESTPKD